MTQFCILKINGIAVMINHLTSETHSVVTPFLPFAFPFACGTLQLLSPFKSAIKSKGSQIVSSTDLLHLLQKRKKRKEKGKSTGKFSCHSAVGFLPASSRSFRVRLNRVRALLRANVPFKKKWSRNENMMWLIHLQPQTRSITVKTPYFYEWPFILKD